MTTARKVFFGVLAAFLVLGLVLGLINVIAPDAASVSVNGEEVEGWASVGPSILLYGIFGLVLGLIASGITALFTRKKS